MSCLRGAWQRQHCLKMTSSRLTCACHQLSARIKFTSGFNSFPQFTPLTSKILLPFFRKLCLSPRVPPPLEGRFGQSSRTWEAGCDGRKGCARRARPVRTAKSYGPDPPTLGSSCAKQVFRSTTVAIKARTPGRSRISRNTIAQGMSDAFRRTCGF